MSNYLSATRLGRFLLKDLVEGYRPLVIAAGAVTGVLLLNYLLGPLSGGGLQRESELLASGAANPTIHIAYFGMTLFIAGFIITSRAFVEVHIKNRNHDWLMLPASSLEKCLSRLLLTTIGVGIGMIVYFWLFSLLAAGLSTLLYGRAYPLFNPADREVGLLLANYLVLQSIFFAGAIYFRRAHFIKTVLAISAFVVALVLLTAVAMRAIVPRELLDLTAPNPLENLDFSAIAPFLQHAARVVSLIAKIFYWAVLAPLFWVFAYFRLTEVEVKNGV